MPGVERAEHAKLLVEDFEAAHTFCTEVLGMVEIDRDGDTVYLGCGLDTNYDLALQRADETRLDHFAFRVDDSDDVDEYASRLERGGVETTRCGGEEPNQPDGVRFSLPEGPDMEMVTVADARHSYPNDPIDDRRSSIAPMDLGHVQLSAHNVEELSRFLVDNLDFHLTEVVDADYVEDDWEISWTRYGDQHHDLAIRYTDKRDYHLHHLALNLSDIGHFKQVVDTICANDVQLEVGPSRHLEGLNIFGYFVAPGGIRFELAAEMVTCDPNMETAFHDRAEEDAFAIWGGNVTLPDSWEKLIGEL